MSVNDIVTSGARLLSFQDYYATSKLDVDLAEKALRYFFSCTFYCAAFLLMAILILLITSL